MAYTQQFGRATTGGNGEPLAEKGLITPTYKKGDFNKLAYEANKTVQDIEANGLGTLKPAEPLIDPKLSSFRVRGTESYKNAVQPKGEDITSGDISKGFTKEGPDRKYPHLSSRFNTNPQIKDPIKRNATQTMRQGALLNDYNDSRTYADIAKTEEDKRARSSFQNHPKIMKEAETAAKTSYKISNSLAKAQISGSESNMLSALNQAMNTTNENQYMRSHPAQVKRNGKWQKGDPVSYENASMVQRYVDRSVRGSKRQDNADVFRYAGQDLQKGITNGKFSLNSNNSSNSNINTNNLFKNSALTTDVTDGNKKRFKF